MSLSCKQVVELVTAYLDGDLDSETVAAVRAHLALCEGCEIYFQQMRATSAALGEVPTQTIPAGVQADLLAAFRGFHAHGPAPAPEQIPD